jgi:hypothetical protein
MSQNFPLWQAERSTASTIELSTHFCSTVLKSCCLQGIDLMRAVYVRTLGFVLDPTLGITKEKVSLMLQMTH